MAQELGRRPRPSHGQESQEDPFQGVRGQPTDGIKAKRA